MNKIKVIIVDKETLDNNPLLNKVLDNEEYFEIVGIMGDSNFNSLINAIKNNPTANLPAIVTNVLHSLGMPVHMNGYDYIRESILLVLNDNKIKSVTKEIYPFVAQKFNTTPTRVERGIRHIIETTWLCGDITKLDSMFNFPMSKGKATNSNFIMTIADNIKMKYNL